MAVYREHRDQHQAPRAPEQGPVAEMVRQFADPHAFLRELVQNGIDAGARSIQVRAELDADRACFSVADDGCGMDRAVVEGPLLTLFRSSKEGDDSKIGRYGVGFVSVFAIQPEVVVVSTRRGSESWVVRLHPDHSYELEEGEPGPAGTTVSIFKRMPETEYGKHARDLETALRRWCRHASCAIQLTTVNAASGESSTARIDRPFALRAAAVVADKLDQDLVLVGPTPGTRLLPAAEPGEEDGADGEDFGGFYNRGLTLEESSQVPPELRGLRFKILSKRLQHTISRDGVKRDGAHDELVRRAAELARAKLPSEVVARLHEQARAAAEGKPSPHYAALLAAATRPPVPFSPGKVRLALVDPVEGKATASLKQILRSSDRGRVPAAAASSNVTRALAARGIPVLLRSDPALLEVLAALLSPISLVLASHGWVLATAIEADATTETDAALCAAALGLLQAAKASVASIHLARCEGMTGSTAHAVNGPSPALLDVRDAPAWWKRWRRNTDLWLDVAHPVVQRARELARQEPQTAASLLVRLLLLRVRGVLDARTHDRLLEALQERAR